MDLNLKGNSAIVTASSSGLGKAAAAALVKEGVNVVINGRDQQKLDQALKELNELKGGRVISCQGLVKESVEFLKAEGGGTVVNISSISVKEAIDNLVLSNSVRMTVIGLMKTLSKELAPEIRVNAVLPGSHETARIEELINSQVENGEFDSYQQGLAAKSKSVPVKKIGTPEKLGDLIAFLSSPKSDYINGSSIVVDGGTGSSNL